MEKRRVVITGMGVVAPTGVGIDNFWDSLVHGRSGVRKITHFDASTYPSQIAAEVPDFDPTNFMDPKTAKRLGRFAQFALASAQMAVDDSEIDFNQEDPYRGGVFVGTAIGGGDVSERFHTVFMEKGMKRIPPYSVFSISTHCASGAISCEFGLKGLNNTISAGCNSGLDACYLAYNSIVKGDADVILVGAGEAPITPYIFAIFCASGYLSKCNNDPKRAVKPYDMESDGLALGEGGAVIVMEELGHAINRNAKIYGEILGYGATNDGYDLFGASTNGTSATVCFKNALMNAQLKPGEIDYINAHGNGYLQYDICETGAIKGAFGECAYRIPISSLKPITGQSLSPTGIYQLMACLLAIRDSIIPPTMNLIHPHPECDLNYVPNHSIEMNIKTAAMNAHGFGGRHTVLIIGKYSKSN
jgi:3-oxoacyl-[acyl-carrier-protein] synthase II